MNLNMMKMSEHNTVAKDKPDDIKNEVLVCVNLDKKVNILVC